MVAASKNGWVVTGIAEGQVSCLQVEESEEHGDKHAALVIRSRQCVVDVHTYLRRRRPLQHVGSRGVLFVEVSLATACKNQQVGIVAGGVAMNFLKPVDDGKCRIQGGSILRIATKQPENDSIMSISAAAAIATAVIWYLLYINSGFSIINS